MAKIDVERIFTFSCLRKGKAKLMSKNFLLKTKCCENHNDLSCDMLAGFILFSPLLRTHIATTDDI